MGQKCEEGGDTSKNTSHPSQFKPYYSDAIRQSAEKRRWQRIRHELVEVTPEGKDVVALINDPKGFGELKSNTALSDR